MDFIHIRVKTDIRNRFKAEAARQNKSMNEIATMLITDYLEKLENLEAA